MRWEQAASIPRVGIPVEGERREVGYERWKKVGKPAFDTFHLHFTIEMNILKPYEIQPQILGKQI